MFGLKNQVLLKGLLPSALTVMKCRGEGMRNILPLEIRELATLVRLSALTYAVTGLCGKECRFWTRSQGLRAMHTFLILCDSAMAIPWMRLPHKNLSNWDIFLHFFIPIAILTFNICLIAQLNQYSLETKAGVNMLFQNAQKVDLSPCCSLSHHPFDRQRPFAPMEGAHLARWTFGLSNVG